MSLIRIILFVFVLVINNHSYAQWGLLRTLGVGGGVHFGVMNPSMDDLNNELKKVGLPTFNRPFLGFGGGGNLSLGGIRIGGYGFGGSQSNQKYRTLSGNYYTSKVIIDYGVGFGTIGYEILNINKFTVSIDLGIGGGNMDIYISDRTTDFNYWEETLLIPLNSSNTSRTLIYSFFSFQPIINFEYYYKNFLKVFVSGDYNIIINDKWRKDRELNLKNVPKINFNGFSLRAGIYFGLYF